MLNNELNLSDKQRVSFEILQTVANFCSEHNIRYYLAYGSLLGAIRHKGFIPWDDDVDLFVPRPDYDRFLATFADTKKYKVLSCYNSKDYVLPFSKVCNTEIKMKLPSGKIIDQGLGIDLFPIDGIPDGLDLKEAEEIFEKENNIFINTVQKYDTFKFLTPKTVKEYIKVFVYRGSIVTGALNKKGRSISVNPFDSEYDECNIVTSAVGIHSGIFRVYRKEWFMPMLVEFEGAQFVAPSGYDTILSMIYPNYMELPPEEERVTTHIASYIWT